MSLSALRENKNNNWKKEQNRANEETDAKDVSNAITAE